MWCFGKINGKLAEVYFENKRGKSVPGAHCFVNKKDYKTKLEKRWIKEDLKRCNLSFRNNEYLDIG